MSLREIVARHVELATLVDTEGAPGWRAVTSLPGLVGVPAGLGEEEPHRYGWTTLQFRPLVVAMPPLPTRTSPPASVVGGLEFTLWNLPMEGYEWLQDHWSQHLEVTVWSRPSPSKSGRVVRVELHHAQPRSVEDAGSLGKIILSGLVDRGRGGRIYTMQAQRSPEDDLPAAV